MDTSIPLLDTPKRASLQSHADILRTDLKEYERTFAAKHGGRKPGKDDIKADAVAAAKYKEYSRVRDVLLGKRGPDALNTPQRHQSTRRRHGRSDSAVSLTPHRGRKSFSPSRPLWHPNDIDPYDPPSSISPKMIPNAIGPTPRRDGTVLGIFDLLSNSGSKKSAESTPGSRKRKIDAIYDGAGEDGSRQLAVAQTPNQKPRQSRDTGNVELQTTTPSTKISAGKRQHSRTPISEGKKFMLDHFFATPSAIRFATMIEGTDDTDAPIQTKTPLRDFVLRISPAKDSETGKWGHATANANDSTPPYLKRTFSFKERLFAASGTAGSKSSPTSTRRGPLRSLGYSKCAPKPLSQIIADLQQSKQDTQQRNEDDNEDDLDALREMEAKEVNALVNDDQTADRVAPLEAMGEQPVAKIWKKKGQKRTTRRVIMRPVKMKPAAAPKFVADDDEEDDDEGDDVDDQETEGELAVALQDVEVEPEGSDTEHLVVEDEESNEVLRDPDAGDETDEFLPVKERASKRPANRKEATLKSKSSSATMRPELQPSLNPDDHFIGNPTKTKPKSKATRKPVGGGSTGQDEGTTTLTTRKINPNAYAHMNFRSLKIKNKNSKAKRAGGRFSRRR